MSAQPQTRETPALTKRSREEIEAAVRHATLELAEQVPFNDLTIDQIARAAGISRTAFYFYFRSKQDLLLAAMEEVADEAFQEADRWWHGSGQPRSLIRAAISGVIDVYERHVNLMRVSQEVAMYDAEVGALWQELMGRFVSATAAHLRREQEAGRLRPLDTQATAESLVWMVERCNYVYLGLGKRSAEQMLETLTEIWFRALYPDAL
jgi:TetR/AcrR family transcriptional regulator, ethionamide resistance regulator